MMQDQMSALAYARNGVTIVRPRGAMDLARRDELSASLGKCTGDVVVDLSDVDFLDATCLGVLIAEHARLVEHGGMLRVREPHGIVSRLLEAAGVATWIVEAEASRLRPA
jgi:anti-anti-sigma factor